MKKKKTLLISGGLLTLIIIISTILIVNQNVSHKEIVMQNDSKHINNSFLTLMLEQSDGTYQESTTNTWPSGSYAFNSELSRCENGGELRWDRENGIVELLSNKSDACYVYFDLYNVVTITNVQATKTTNSVTLTVTVDAGENPVSTYYFSMDGGNSYQESSTNTYTFSNLDYGTSYTFQVYAVDSQGYESNEEVIEVTTDNYVNPVINSVTSTSVSNNSITVSVSATAGTNAIQTYYYSINNGSYTSSSSNSYTFNGLSAGQSYSIRVYVKDTNGIDSNVYTINAETDNQPLTLAEACSNGDNLANCITSFYNASGSDITKIYYHNSDLANGAGDNSYRYAGASDEVNNYVCFGSTASTCPSNNLYRIIGVFGNQVKLIMADYPTTSQTGTGGAYYNTYSGAGEVTSSYKGDQSLSSVGVYYWNLSGTNTWSSSSLTTTNLNSTFLNSISSIWRNKIVDATWYVNGYSSNAVTPATWHNAESIGTTWIGKIGLMYVSDYGFAASPSAWLTVMYLYNSALNTNWLYMGLLEWTVSRSTRSNDMAFFVNSNGVIGGYGVSNSYTVLAIRPCFYLNSNVTYVSGSGTQSDPIRIN